jgi:hypothetical protein
MYAIIRLYVIILERYYMFHLLAYSASIAANTETDLTPVQDDIVPIQNGHFLPQSGMNVLFATGMATDISKLRIVTPTLRQVTTPFIRPLIPALIGGTLRFVDNYLRNPIYLQALEEVSLLGTQTGGGAEQTTALLAISPAPPAVSTAGAVYRMRGTGATTVTAHGWTTCPITWNDSLPAGVYSVIGLTAIGVTCQAARLIFQGQVWRPGVLGIHAVTDIEDSLMKDGRLGEFGRFTQTALPQVQFLCNAADTAQEVYLDIIRQS